MSIKISVAASESEMQELYRYWYKIYVETQGKLFGCANSEKRILRDSLDETAVVFYAREGDSIVGSIRINFFEKIDFPAGYRDIFGFDNFYAHNRRISCSSRFIMDKGFENSELPVNLAFKAFTVFREKRILFDFCLSPLECVMFYKKLGYLTYKESVEDPYNGPSLPMVLIVNDQGHLETLGSPLGRFGQLSVT